MLKNFIRNYRLVDMVSDTIELCRVLGFKLERRIKHILNAQSFWRVNYKKQWTEKFPDKLFPRKKFACARALPPKAVKTIEDLIFWQYAKTISESAGYGKKQFGFACIACMSKQSMSFLRNREGYGTKAVNYACMQ